MSRNPDFTRQVAALVENDPRYHRQAYLFIGRVIAFVNRANRENRTEEHLDGPALLDGFRQLALLEFGPLTLDVLQEWGIFSTRDVGNLVFNMVEHNLLLTSDRDSPADYIDAYDFHEAFLTPRITANEVVTTKPDQLIV